MSTHYQRPHSATSYLQDNPLVDGKLGDDVGEQQVAVVLGGGVHAALGQQARPRERHQPPQLVTLLPGDTATWGLYNKSNMWLEFALATPKLGSSKHKSFLQNVVCQLRVFLQALSLVSKYTQQGLFITWKLSV